MTKNKKGTPVDVVDPAECYLSVAEEGTELSGADLEAAGVDMRVTKADILELVTAQMRDHLEEEYARLRLEFIDAEVAVYEATKAYARKEYRAVFDAFCRDGKEPAVYLGVQYDGYGHSTDGALYVNIDTSLVIDRVRARREVKKELSFSLGGCLPVYYSTGRRSCVVYEVKTKKSAQYVKLRAVFEVEKDALPENIQTAVDNRSAITAKLAEVTSDYANTDKVGRKARYMLANKILSATKEGKKLLKNLNSFKTRKVRAFTV